MSLRLVLIACFAIYGTFAQAGMSENGHSFTIEICADGAAKTIRVDANGAPVDPAAPCCDCLTCAQLAAAPSSLPNMAVVVQLNYGFVSDTVWTAPLLVKKPDTRPLPRGPPLVAHSALNTADATCDDHTRGNGRHLFKDALA